MRISKNIKPSERPCIVQLNTSGNIICFKRIVLRVFQEKLQNSFRQATSKISATIGLGLPREETINPEVPIEGNNENVFIANDGITATDDNDE